MAYRFTTNIAGTKALIKGFWAPHIGSGYPIAAPSIYKDNL